MICKTKYYVKGQKFYDNGQHVKAFQTFLEGSQKGDLLCACRYAVMQENGYACYPNPKQAFRSWEILLPHLQKFSREGSIDAMRFQGYALMYGVAEKNIPLAKSCYLSAAERGCKYALGAVATMYLFGINSHVDVNEALKWALKSIKAGNENSYHLVARCYNELGDTKNCLKYVKLAKKGIPLQQLIVGSWYRDGYAVPKDLKQAQKLFASAAKADMPVAQYDYAQSLIEGYDKKDIHKGITLLMKIAPYNLSAAEYLGDIYSQNKVTYPDTDLALKYYKMAVDGGSDTAQEKYNAVFGKTKKGKQTLKFEDALKKSNQNDTDAMVDLALCYEHGTGTRKNSKKAFEICKKAADLGNAEGKLLLARYYEQAVGCRQDFAKAFALYEQLVELNQPGGYSFAGLALLEGNGVQKDVRRGLQYIQKGADLGSASACRNIGLIYADGEYGVTPDYDKAHHYFVQATKAGNTKAYGSLAKLHYDKTKRYDQAVYYARQGEKQSDPLSCHVLGVLYKRGLGVEQNDKIAMDCWVKGSKEDGGCCTYLGQMYLLGDGVDKDVNIAYHWYTKGCELGDAQCLYQAGFFLLGNQPGFDRVDVQRAIELIKLSAEQGNDKALCELAICYQNGKGVAKSYQKAYDYYHIALKLGCSTAYTGLGTMYYNGYGVQVNIQKALTYFKKGMELGDLNAYNLLGMIYYYGKGVPANKTLGLQYVTYAAQQGYRASQKWLTSMGKSW